MASLTDIYAILQAGVQAIAKLTTAVQPPVGTMATAQPVGTAVTVGSASAQAIGQNLSRRGLMFYNASSAYAVWIAPSTAAAVINGAGSFSLSNNQFFIFDSLRATTSWNAISSGSVPLTVFEWGS